MLIIIKRMFEPGFHNLINFLNLLKGTNSPYMFVLIWKQYTENFAFLILRTVELFTSEVCKFLKK